MRNSNSLTLAVVLMLFSAGCLHAGGAGLGSNLNPQAVVTVASGQKVVELGSTIRFDASESLDEDGAIIAYRWDFGDGSKGTSALENHKYFYPGEYIVSLSVTDDKGAVGNNDRRLTYVEMEDLALNLDRSDQNPDLVRRKPLRIGTGQTFQFLGHCGVLVGGRLEP